MNIETLLFHSDACPASDLIPIKLILRSEAIKYRESQSDRIRNWLQVSDFAGRDSDMTLLMDADGKLEAVYAGIDSQSVLWRISAISQSLPEGRYQIEFEADDCAANHIALGWILGQYHFAKYKTKKTATFGAALLWPATADSDYVRAMSKSIYLMRDMVNTPAADMNPLGLTSTVEEWASAYDAQAKVIVGEDLIESNYPLIHAVGKASTVAPRLIDLSWGEAAAPRLTIIGKGVCFDSGGLNIKDTNGMRYMKKDMAGAAQALALAVMIMQSRLKVSLRLLIPAVENAISGNALRPGDILTSRLGDTVEITNTDGEGRVILADAVTEASESGSDLIIDFATLTGAQRIALGYDLPAFFTNRDDIASELENCANSEEDPIWRLPLYQNYRSQLNSQVADLMNHTSSRIGGSIIAALFLQNFLANDTPWIHFDFMGWNDSARPGQPEGGEAQGLRAVYAYLQKRYAS